MEKTHTGCAPRHRDGLARLLIVIMSTAPSETIPGDIMAPNKCTSNSFSCRYNKPCLDSCSSRGENYFWCHTEGGSWDYCSPAWPTTAVTVMTKGGKECTGICDKYSSCYEWCISLGSDGGWGYCGSGCGGLFRPVWWIVILMGAANENSP